MSSKYALSDAALKCIRDRLHGVNRVRIRDKNGVVMRRRASVLVPLASLDGVPNVVFTLRTSTLSTHAGQAAFPGGHTDEGEVAVETALRELQEELGVILNAKEDVLGMWHESLSITDVVVTPVVGWLGEFRSEDHLFSTLTLSPHEVAGVFSISFENLLEHSHEETLRGHPSRNHTLVTRRFTAGQAPVWGLTAHILDGLLNEVLIPCTRVAAID